MKPIVTLFVGLIVGAIAKFLLPGNDPGGWFMTVLLGIGGSFIGNFIAETLGLPKLAVWIPSALLVVLLLFLMRQPPRYAPNWEMRMNEGFSRQAGGIYGGSGRTSIEYKRAYNDGLKGNEYDTYRHPQDYKDGFRAGEDARRSGSHANGSAGEYDINRLSNGSFEVVWPRRGCIGTFNSHGEAMRFNERCNDDLTNRSREIARHERY